MQEKGGTFTRIALLCLIALGLLGAICLLLYLAVKLVLAGLLSLLLLLLAPAMLLAPAFGDSGRATFVAWAKRLVGAIAAKLIYALLLALVVVAATSLATLPVGWFGSWLLQIAFWWGILLKRHELTGFVSIGQHGDERGGKSDLYHHYRNARAAREVAGGASAAAVALPLLAGRRARREHADRGEASRRAVAIAGREELDRSAERARELELADARQLMGERRALERSRAALNRSLAPYDEHVAEAAATSAEPHEPDEKVAAMLRSRAVAEKRLDSEEMRRAQALVREAERAEAREGRIIPEAERAAWRDQRRIDIEHGLAPEHPRSLRAAGIDPRDYRAAAEEERRAMRERSTEAIEHDRDLLRGIPREDRRQPLPADTRAAARRIPPQELRRRRPEERAAWRHERSVRQRRGHLYRR